MFQHPRVEFDPQSIFWDALRVPYVRNPSSRGAARLRQGDQRRARIGLEPLASPEARLKSNDVLLGTQAQLGGEQPRGLLAMAMVGIAEVQRPTRHAVKRQHELVGAAVLNPVFVDT